MIKHSISRRILSWMLLFVLLCGLLAPGAAAESSPETLEIDDADGIIAEDALYALIQDYGQGVAGFNDYFVITLDYDGTKVDTLVTPGAIHPAFSYTLKQGLSYPVYPCTGNISYSSHSGFSATKDEASLFYVKLKGSVSPTPTPTPVPDSSIVLSAENSSAGSVCVVTDGSKTVLTAQSTATIANSTQHSITAVPTAEYAVTDITVTPVGTDTPVNSGLSFSTDGSRTASTVFTAGISQEYTVSVGYVKPAVTAAAPDNADDGSYDLYYTAAMSKTELERQLTAKIIASTVPADLPLASVEYLAGDGQWKPLDFENSSSDAALHEFGENSDSETVRIRYGGNDQYPAVSIAAKVLLYRKPLAAIDIKAQTVPAGSSYEYDVTTTPAGIAHLVIAINMADTSIRVQVPASIQNKLGSRYTSLVLATQDGVTLARFSQLIEDLADELDALAGTAQDSGVDTNALRKIPGFIAPYITDQTAELTIELDKKPDQAGEYILWAITADAAYTTAADHASLTISQPADGVMLQFNRAMESGTLSLAEASAFPFGGKVTGSTEDLSAFVKAEYFQIGTEGAETPVTLAQMLTTPGDYRETISFTGDTHSLSPIQRSFTLIEKKALIQFENTTYLVTDYDGKGHALPAGVYTEDGERLGDAVLTYVFVDTENNYELIPLESSLPTEPGFYLVLAAYAGSDEYPSASIQGTVTITKPTASLTIPDYETFYGDPVDLSQVEYTNSKLSQEHLQLLLNSLRCSSTEHHSVCEHAMELEVPESLKAYYSQITVTVGKHIVQPREIIIRLDDQEKTAGESDPVFTYQLEGSFMQGDAPAQVTVSRESGENPGAYKITAAVADAGNYSYRVMDGTLTIHPASSGSGTGSDSSSGGNSEVVATGDDRPLSLYAGLLLLSLSALTALLFRWKRQS